MRPEVLAAIETAIAAVLETARTALAEVRALARLPGPAGTSVVAARINTDGNLIVELSDGTQIDAGLARSRDGRDGADAAPVTPEQIASAVAAHIEAHPIENGRDGKDGRDGADASDEQIGAAVARYLTENPPPAGRDGADGRGINQALIDSAGHLVLTCTDGDVIVLGSVAASDGEDGKDGASVVSADIDARGHLVLVLSDGRSIDAGIAVKATTADTEVADEEFERRVRLALCDDVDLSENASEPAS